MNWLAFGLAAAAGAVAALIAMFLVPKPNERRVAYTVVFVVSFTVLNILAKESVLPRLTISADMANAERDLLLLPAFQAMKQHDPATYDALMSDLRVGLIERKSGEQLLAEVKPRIEQMVLRRLPLASDETVVTYMEVTIREMRELNEQDPELCYKLLFPQQYGTINALAYLPRELVDADSAALAQVIRTSAERSRVILSEPDVSIDLNDVVTGLEKRHGDSIAVLQDLHNPTVNKAVACNLIADLYAGVLELPLERSSELIRYLLSQE